MQSRNKLGTALDNKNYLGQALLLLYGVSGVLKLMIETLRKMKTGNSLYA